MINRKVLNDLKDKFLSRWKYSERKAISEMWDLHYQGGGVLSRRVILQMKGGEIKVGDTVFYYPYEEFATLVELPSSPYGISSKATVRISSGGTRKVDIYNLWKWWHGNEKDEELHKQIAKKITDEDRDEAREVIEKKFMPGYERDLPEIFGTTKITEITDNGIMKISIFGDTTLDSDLQDTFHYDIEYGIKLWVRAIKAVIVDFHSKDDSSHIVVGT